MFFDVVVKHAREHWESTKPPSDIGGMISILRNDNTYQVAEFYFMLDEFGMSDPVCLGRFIDRHNQDMEELLASPDQMAAQGLPKARVFDAIFSSEQRAKVLENAARGQLRLDQSDIGRFLATLMSPETCRKTLVALASAGLLERKSIGQVIIVSSGVVEGFFRAHLRYIADAIREIA